jgi:ABC-type polysaccharide/polyol phosphate export permease
MRVTPLYHAVAMLRQLTTGGVDVYLAGHIAYLVTLGAAAFALAMHRFDRALIK